MTHTFWKSVLVWLLWAYLSYGYVYLVGSPGSPGEHFLWDSQSTSVTIISTKCAQHVKHCTRSTSITFEGGICLQSHYARTVFLLRVRSAGVSKTA